VGFGDRALGAIGYRGEVACGAYPLGAHFELHIEQGPILGAKGLDLGIVTGVQGIRWYELQVHGSETHAGRCPMSMRQNLAPVLVALVSELYALALNQGDEARCTIGRMKTTRSSSEMYFYAPPKGVVQQLSCDHELTCPSRELLPASPCSDRHSRSTRPAGACRG
jgi:acetylornithine deacetylase/succinyl-diaminopimelate desuccinylase-like protein